MKTLAKIFAAAVAIALSLPVFAGGFDEFGQTRTLLFQPVRILTVADKTSTSPVIDLRSFDGVVKLDVTAITNTPGGTLTIALQTASDPTNSSSWTTITTAYYATSSTVNFTNPFVPIPPFVATNTYLLPGSVTTPTAYSYGASGQYLNPAQPTNTVTALDVSTAGTYSVGWNAQDSYRYGRLVYTTGGTATNITISAILTGRKSNMLP